MEGASERNWKGRRRDGGGRSSATSFMQILPSEERPRGLPGRGLDCVPDRARAWKYIYANTDTYN